MAEYIDRDLALYRMRVDPAPPFKVVAEIPAAEVEPVRHGRWNPDGSCSECGEFDNKDPYGSNYCPNCGAKMDVKEGQK